MKDQTLICPIFTQLWHTQFSTGQFLNSVIIQVNTSTLTVVPNLEINRQAPDKNEPNIHEFWKTLCVVLVATLCGLKIFINILQNTI